MKQFLFLLFFITLFVPLIATSAIDLNLEYPRLGNIELNCDQITEADKVAGVRCGQDLNALIAWIYYLIVGISGLAAFAMLVWGGMQWLSSAGNPGQITDAKDRIQKALLGLLLVLGSFLIIQIINPELTILKEPGLTRANIPSGGGGRCFGPVTDPTKNCYINDPVFKSIWGTQTTIENASKVCSTESTDLNEYSLNPTCILGPDDPDDIDSLPPYIGYDYSVGLFQINLYRTGRCPGALGPKYPELDDPNNPRDDESANRRFCTILDANKLAVCRIQYGYGNAEINYRKAKEIYDAANGWSPWTTAGPQWCNLY